MRTPEFLGRGCLAGLALLFAGACSGGAELSETPPRAGGFHFVDVSAQAGFDRLLHAGRPGKDHLLDSAGFGAAWLDYDGDGRLDAYVVNGWRIEEGAIVERGRNALYRNRGDGTFEDATEAAGVDGDGRWCSGVAVADVDDDGLPDLFVTVFGANLLYRNLGDGTFEEIAEALGVDAPGWNTGAAFFDADLDGDLDLYVAAYIEATVDEVLAGERTLDWKGVARVAPGPFGMPGAPDRFFVQNDDGTFTERTAEAGLSDRALGFGFAVRALDVEDDGDLDLYIANDSDANYLYRNEGDGTFKDTGTWAGAAFDANGAAQAGMGLAVGDINGDLAPDLFVTNFSEDFSTLYVGDGDGFFRDASDDSAIGAATYQPLSWGTLLADLDNDGDDDLVVANGHIYPQVDDHPEVSQTYVQRDLLLENEGNGHFIEVGKSAGPGFAIERSSRGLAAGDYDDDGDLDLLLTALDEPPLLLRNDTPGGHWISVALVAPPGSGGTIGAVVEVRAGALRRRRDLASGESFLSAHDPRLHFGLGSAARVDELLVRWPDGQVERWSDLEADRFFTAARGEGAPAQEAWSGEVS